MFLYVVYAAAVYSPQPPAVGRHALHTRRHEATGVRDFYKNARNSIRLSCLNVVFRTLYLIYTSKFAEN